jgi:hypothetical protein
MYQCNVLENVFGEFPVLSIISISPEEGHSPYALSLGSNQIAS